MAKSSLCIWLVGVILVARYPGVFSNTVSLSSSGPAYEGGIAGFSATGPVRTTITAIRWTLNGIPITELPDITTDPILVDMQTVNLVITNVSAVYNGNTVTCTGTLSSGVSVSCTPTAILQVQGVLDPVEQLSTQYNVMDNTVNISWSPPPAILVPEQGITVTRPERFYCVQISNGTTTESRGCNRSADMNAETSIIQSNVECGVNYDITITPYNRLGDGPQTSTVFPDAPQIAIPGTPQSTNFTYVYEVSGLVCTCSAVITDMDMDIEGSLQCDVNTPTPGSLTITTIDVTLNKKFDIAINATNSRASTLKTDEISTYDLNDLIVTSTADSVVNILLIFVPGTNARGVFIALLFRPTSQEIDFSRSVFFILRRGAQPSNQLSGLSGGNYTALAYDVEETGVITSGRPADEEMITVTGPANPPGGVMNLVSFGVDINCTSNITVDMRAVSVTCQFEIMNYTGFLVTLMYEGNVIPVTSVKSTESGSTVTVNGTMRGEHTVVVNPTFGPDVIIPDMVQPVLMEVYNLLGLTTPTIASTTQALTTDTPQGGSSTSSATSGSSASTTTRSPMGTSGPQSDMGTIIGVVIGIILIIIIVGVIIVFVAVLLMRWNRKRKTVSVRRDEAAFIMAEKNGKQSPSSDTEADNYHIPPVYATAGPPKIPAHEPLTANGGDNPPPEGAPPPPEGAADLYSVVDKSKPQEQMYETVQLKKPSNKKVEDVHLVEYASLQYIDPTPSEKDSEVPPPVPPHSEEEGPTFVRQVDCYEVLSGMAAYWKVFAGKLRVDEDFIDEIDCNNESDVGCLSHFLSTVVKHRSREEMAEVLEMMELLDEAKAVLKLPSIKKF